VGLILHRRKVFLVFGFLENINEGGHPNATALVNGIYEGGHLNVTASVDRLTGLTASVEAQLTVTF
jgi:hypothetical protein